MAQKTPTKNQETAPEGAALPGGALPGQLTQPNPLELLWEKNKKQIILVLIVVLGVLGGTRLWGYLEVRERNQRWSTFAAGVEFEERYEPTYGSNGLYFFAYQPYRKFADNLRALPIDQAEQAATDLAGTPAGVLANWILASRHAIEGDEAGAKAALDAIVKNDASDPGLVKRSYPPIYVPLPEDEKKDENGAKKPTDKVVPPEPDAAAQRDLLLGMAGNMKRFREANPELYAAPEPDAKPEITFETTAGNFTVRLYAKRAPKHCAKFLANCKEKLYDGLRFHRVQRAPASGSQDVTTPELAFFGDPETKDENTEKWGTFHSKEQTEFEQSGLSHFPFMLAADRETDKTGSDQRIVYFTANDCAEQRDDSNVVFGRVVSGEEVIERITRADLSSTAENESGTGRPATAIKVTAVTVVE